ncbi:MAG TPA: DUF998 domain-containing protein [Candidatus Saccharimonadales bacterium]|nr:DUF998 domain-containing protein [Candidatus Saccharimonadales bacterium]
MSLRKGDRQLLIGLSVAAGLLYNSWPLGYWLNPAVSRTSLASGLEAAGQPYNWVFIGGDIASSVLAIVVCVMLWRRLARRQAAVLIRAAIILVGLFAGGTIIDSLLPERCIPGFQRCASFTQDHTLLFHGIFSIGASVALFMSLSVVWLRHRYNLLFNGVLLAYIVFAMLSLGEAMLPGKFGNWSQHYYITLCSVWLALIPYAFNLMSQQQEAAHAHAKS